jgi:hypothetical protein
MNSRGLRSTGLSRARKPSSLGKKLTGFFNSLLTHLGSSPPIGNAGGQTRAGPLLSFHQTGSRLEEDGEQVCVRPIVGAWC